VGDRVEVPLSIRLDQLHRVFQIVMGSEDYHLGVPHRARLACSVPDPD